MLIFYQKLLFCRTRFHIICAERLCEESHHDFSPKLNDENLTKCLQTLQYIYYDLSLEGIPCPREYEFRAYDVLMNMNQGDTLRKVQTLGEHLRTHDRVKFAIKCFTALNSNNYVGFFNLVRKASFLEACILKRYFYQVFVPFLSNHYLVFLYRYVVEEL